MLPRRRIHRRIGQVSASWPEESSPYRRSQHTFVSDLEILLGRRALLAGSRPPFPASAKLRRESLPATSARTRPSARNPTWPQPSSCRGQPCRAARRELSQPESASVLRERLPRSTEFRLPLSRSLRRKLLRCAFQNPRGED